MNILIRTIQDSYLVLSYLFCLKRYCKSKLLHFFFDFWSDFWYPRKGNCLLFVSVGINIIVDTTCFLFKVINHLLQYFLFMSIFAKHFLYSRIFYFHLQIFFRTDFGRSCKKSFDPTSLLTSKIEKHFATLRKQLKFETRTYFQLYPSDPIPACLYGVVKSHKSEKCYPM